MSILRMQPRNPVKEQDDVSGKITIGNSGGFDKTGGGGGPTSYRDQSHLQSKKNGSWSLNIDTIDSVSASGERSQVMFLIKIRQQTIQT